MGYEILFTFISGNALEAADNGGFFSSFIGYDAGSLSSTIFSLNGPTPWFILFVLATTIVVIFGVEKGIEKASRIMMPILAILAIVIAIYSLTIPGALQGLKYYILPISRSFRYLPCLARWDRCSTRCRWQWVL